MQVSTPSVRIASQGLNGNSIGRCIFKEKLLMPSRSDFSHCPLWCSFSLALKSSLLLRLRWGCLLQAVSKNVGFKIVFLFICPKYGFR